ncbi:cadherin-1-like [Silurus meridionalis]|uniref:cadherin-1-like n=1 Tax=Silurus meridionalis TaxID=175797 RepID=UPI001EEADD36|nr:cadherin-1-like [Silurus meridionalis]XP_046696304.1 cadherin-1-like [Silurus meridionalis]
MIEDLSQRRLQIISDYGKETQMMYRITGEGADQPPVGLFTIDKNTGQLYVSKPLDREQKDIYKLQVHAWSNADGIKEPSIEIIVEVIDQNDNSPVFTQDVFPGFVPETAKIGLEFMTITATDADDPDTDNADIRYSIISQTPSEPNPNMFAINPITGAIRVNAEGLDRQKYHKYTLEIQAADMQGDGRPVIAKAVITVTDQTSKWKIPPINIPENDRGPFPKQLVQIISDYGKETQMIYRITGEGADQPPVGLFTIDKNTGQLYVSKPLDREQKDIYKLQAHAWSNADGIKEPSIEIIVKVIDLNDNSPAFTQDVFPGFVPETAKIGLEFMTITATDADDPDTDNADIRYSIISQTPSEPNPNMFAINPITGAIRVNAEGLDRQKYHKYTLEIQAADMQGDGRPVTAKAVITVTDQTSKSEIPPINIPENDRGPFPKQLVQIRTSHAKNTRVTYSITGSGANLPPVGLFLMDKNTGMLYLARSLDRETRDKYELQVHAIGDDMHDEYTQILIHVVDQNDNKPIFSQDPFIGSVSDKSKTGHKFMTISATDADDPNTNNAAIRYSIINQTPPEPSPNMFEINPVTGAIGVNAEGLDKVKHSKYILKIQAADMEGHGLSSTGNAVIFVTDTEDSPPRKWEISHIGIPENERGPFPKQIAQIKSSHASQAKIVYSLTGEGANQDPVGVFMVDKINGWLSVTTSLDREKKNEYVLQVHYTGEGINEPPTEITIRVIDQNDNKPIFTQDPFQGTVPQASKIGFLVMTISATDADNPNTENTNIRYSIISQDPLLPHPNMFAIDPITGELKVNAEGFDKEKYPEYTLEIQAADLQGNGLQSTGKTVITVTT